MVSKGKDSKGRFASNYDFYEVPNQPPPIAVRSNVAAFSKPSRNTEAATENPTAATADGKPQTENRNVKPTTDNCDGLYIYSIKRKDKRKEENKVKNPLTHTRARENFEIKNIAVDPQNQGKGYGKALIDFLASKYADEYSVLQVGTGDSPLTIPFYEKCGFVRSHKIPNFFTDNYDHTIYEGGVQLIDMVYLQRHI